LSSLLLSANELGETSFWILLTRRSPGLELQRKELLNALERKETERGDLLKEIERKELKCGELLEALEIKEAERRELEEIAKDKQDGYEFVEFALAWGSQKDLELTAGLVAWWR
jgi:hypothetical protein